MSESTNHETRECPECDGTGRTPFLRFLQTARGECDFCEGTGLAPAPSHTERGGETSKGPESCVTTDGTQVDLARFEGRQEPPAATTGPAPDRKAEEGEVALGDEGEGRDAAVAKAKAFCRAHIPGWDEDEFRAGYGRALEDAEARIEEYGVQMRKGEYREGWDAAMDAALDVLAALREGEQR